MDWTQLQYILRILAACLCGICIGLERKNRAKEAGVRTHCVVACGAALMMIISKYAFFDLITGDLSGGADVRLDPSRVASTIASGIGFLGAGMIFVHRNTITGLTTAAGIWATSGVGMALGAGMYTVGFAATGIIILVQVVFHMNRRSRTNYRLRKLKIKNVTDPDFQQYFTNVLTAHQITVISVNIEKAETGRTYTFMIEIMCDILEDQILSLTPYPGIIAAVGDA